MSDVTAEDLIKSPTFTDDEIRQREIEARELLQNPILLWAFAEMRRRAFAELAAAVPGHLTSVPLHAKLCAVEALPGLLQLVLNDAAHLRNRAKGKHNV